MLLLDDNECTNGKEECEEICINTPGSYQCNCTEGKELNADKKSCDSKYSWQVQQVLIA